MGEYEKLEIGVELLESALFHFLETRQYFTAIQCAGAAEELLGSYVETLGGKSAFSIAVNSTSEVSKLLSGCTPKIGGVKRVINYPKNATKHMDGEDDNVIIVDPVEAASDLIDRAVENYDYVAKRRGLGELSRFYEYQQRFTR